MNYKKGFTLIELLVVIAIIAVLSSIVMASLNGGRSKARDATRLATMRQISYALELYYYANNNQYPQCLYAGGSCVTTLNGSTYMKSVPKDPLTGLNYSYAGNGSGATCTGYHLGASMENTTATYMQSGKDAPPRTICTNSGADFSGLSTAAGGQLCNLTVGTPQPGGTETCHDVTEQ